MARSSGSTPRSSLLWPTGRTAWSLVLASSGLCSTRGTTYAHGPNPWKSMLYSALLSLARRSNPLFVQALRQLPEHTFNSMCSFWIEWLAAEHAGARAPQNGHHVPFHERWLECEAYCDDERALDVQDAADMGEWLTLLHEERLTAAAGPDAVSYTHLTLPTKA